MRLSKLQKIRPSSNWQVHYGLCSASGNWKKKKLRHFVNTIAQFTNACSIHSGFYQWKMIDDNKKSLFRIWTLKPNFFHSAYVNSCTMLNQRRSWSCVRLTAHLAIKCLMANYFTRWCWIFKGLSHDVGRGIFLKNLRNTSINKDLSKEHNFSLIHLAGQYL